MVADQAKTRLDRIMALKPQEHRLVAAAREREYVEAMLGLQVWAHKLYLAATGGPTTVARALPDLPLRQGVGLLPGVGAG